METNSGKLVIFLQLETDAGSELPLTPFDVIHPGLAAVKVDMFQQLTSHIPRHQRDKNSECETAKGFNQNAVWHTDLDFLCTVNAWGWGNCLRGVYFALKQFFLCICNPCMFIW